MCSGSSMQLQTKVCRGPAVAVTEVGCLVRGFEALELTAGGSQGEEDGLLWHDQIRELQATYKKRSKH